MDNFRRVEMYGKLPSNARLLQSSDYGTTTIKNIWVPIFNVPLSGLDHYGRYYFYYADANGNSCPYIDNNHLDPETNCYLGGFDSHNDPYIDYSLYYSSRLHTYTLQCAMSCGSSMYNANNEREEGIQSLTAYRFTVPTSNTLALWRYTQTFKWGILPDEILTELVSSDDPMFIKISYKQWCVFPDYPYILISGFNIYDYSTIDYKFPIYIEPVED